MKTEIPKPEIVDSDSTSVLASTSDIKINLGYLCIDYSGGGSGIINMWPFLSPTNLTDNSVSIPSLDGTTIPYKTAPIIVSIIGSIINTSSSNITVLSGLISSLPSGSAIPSNSADLYIGGLNNWTFTSSVEIPANSSVAVQFKSAYQIGQFPSFTFPNVNTGYGSISVVPTLKIYDGNGNLIEFTPQQETQKILAWK